MPEAGRPFFVVGSVIIKRSLCLSVFTYVNRYACMTAYGLVTCVHACLIVTYVSSLSAIYQQDCDYVCTVLYASVLYAVFSILYAMCSVFELILYSL